MLQNKNLSYFLDYFKILAISNPDKEITEEMIRIEMVNYGMEESGALNLIDIRNFIKEKPECELNETEAFIQYCHNKPFIKKNCIKLYFPFQKSHFCNSVLALTRYVEEKEMDYALLISKEMRNDNCVLRVNTMREAEEIIEFVKEHKLLQNSLNEVNPFIPSVEKIGIVKDYYHSYNKEISKAFSKYIQLKKEEKKLEEISVEQFKDYLSFLSQQEDLEVDKRKIYYLASRAINESKEEYFDILLQDEIVMNLTTQEGRRKLLEEVLTVAMKNYNNLTYLKETLKLCCQGICEGIPREENARKKILSLSQEELIFEIKAWGKSENLEEAIETVVTQIAQQDLVNDLDNLPIEDLSVEEMPELSLENTSVNSSYQEIDDLLIKNYIDHAILMTYQGHGREQAIVAMLKCIKEGEYNRVAREAGARDNLRQISMTQITQFFIHHSNCYNITEAVVDYVDQLINNYSLDMNNRKK